MSCEGRTTFERECVSTRRKAEVPIGTDPLFIDAADFALSSPARNKSPPAIFTRVSSVRRPQKDRGGQAIKRVRTHHPDAKWRIPPPRPDVAPVSKFKSFAFYSAQASLIAHCPFNAAAVGAWRSRAHTCARTPSQLPPALTNLRSGCRCGPERACHAGGCGASGRTLVSAGRRHAYRTRHHGGTSFYKQQEEGTAVCYTLAGRRRVFSKYSRSNAILVLEGRMLLSRRRTGTVTATAKSG